MSETEADELRVNLAPLAALAGRRWARCEPLPGRVLMQHDGASNTLADTMPAKPRPSAMTPQQLRELMDAHGLTSLQLAAALKVHRNTVSRWLRHVEGKKIGTPIDAASAALILATFKPKKK